MEKNNIRKTVGRALLLLFFLLSHNPTSSSQQSIHPDQTFSRTPTPSPPFRPLSSSTRASLRQILLGVLLGSLTGAFSSIIFLFLIRLFLLLANRTPILKGPVTFSPKISPKALKSVVSVNVGSPQILGSFPNGKYLKLALDSQITVAVKVFESIRSNGAPRSSSSWKRRVQRELELLAKVNHTNVMSLRAYIHDRDRLSLVFDYSPNGSLHDAMKRVRSEELQLVWGIKASDCGRDGEGTEVSALLNVTQEFCIII
ncbi:hypothetical protein HPP92_013595 [Vanilla planifolia]|uniref:Protein kinase domain-containing protein n=1 Tax=Vanilla planifolia TaxID=51239 RepID=A0A835UUY9_VANPL|nr:hypothetical protein HPP92_013595 [Vanilla planifolia]